MKHKEKKVGARALKIVQKYHPNVTSVVDSKNDLVIEVTDHDDKNSKIKNHAHCAMAEACQRQEHADGAIISVSSAYIIKGDVAIRYRIPESVSREVVSFDRKGGFEPGIYKLNKPYRAELLGNGLPHGKPSGTKPNRAATKFIHKTQNIRTNLNSDTM